jgi:hypothetical protein
MNEGIFRLGAGTAAAVVLAVLGLATPNTAQAGVCTFGAGGPGALQGVFDSFTLNPAGASSVNVATDCIADGADSTWQIGGSGGSVNTLIVEFAGFANSNTFGIYDAANPATTIQLFSGTDSPGFTMGGQHTVSISGTGVVLVDAAFAGNITGNAFGYYLTSPQGTFYSDTLLNPDGTDHMHAYQGVGDIIQIPPPPTIPAEQFAAGPWGTNEWVLAWEDLLGPCSPTGNADCDYTDFVVLVESVSPVPEPTSLAIVGIGLLGLGVANRRRTRKS